LEHGFELNQMEAFWAVFAIAGAAGLGYVFWPMIRARLAERNRAIFRFYAGSGKYRSIDPMIPFRILMQHPDFDWEKDPERLQNAQKAAESGDRGILKLVFGILDTMTPAVRQAFDVKLFAEGGLTEGECTDLLAEFMIWMAAIKKKRNISPISTEPTASDPSDSAMPNGSECSSTAAESEEPAASIA
jgi:hypothetical protein